MCQYLCISLPCLLCVIFCCDIKNCRGILCIFRDDSEEVLSKEMMKIIGRVESLQKFVRQADYTFYNILVDILMPDVLRPVPSVFLITLECVFLTVLTRYF